MAVAIPYLVVGAIGVIGYALVGKTGGGQKNQQPNDAPMMNQSLRGSSMFVTFGTNRVSAQITWTKNWNAVRQKSSGKKGGGKGGGSGGLGAAKGGGSAGQNYEYFWDMQFHYGMVDKPSAFTRAWVGADPVKDATVSAMNQNALPPSTSKPAGLGIFGNFVSLITKSNSVTNVTSNIADLKYTEVFYAPGNATGSTELETWDYFETQEHVACAWPSTAWLGFKALDLGQSGQPPQLSLELCPFDSLDFDIEPEYESIISAAAIGAGTMGSESGGMGYVCGEDGKHYFVASANVRQISLVPVEGGDPIIISQTQFTSDVGTGFTTGQPTYFPIAGTPYCVYLGVGTSTGHFNYAWAVYKVNASGTFEFVSKGTSDTLGTNYLVIGGDVRGCSYIGGILRLVFSVDNGLHGNGTSIMHVAFDATNGTFGMDPTFDNNFTDIDPCDADFFDFVSHNRSYSHTTTPTADDGFILYVGQAEYDYMAANSSDNPLWASFTHPGVWYVDSGGATDINSDFAFDDIKTNLDGSASSNYYDDYVAPELVEFNEGNTYLAFNRGYTATADAYKTRLRLYTWDQDSLSASPITDATETLFTGTDISGASGGYPEWVSIGIDPVSNRAFWTFYGHVSPTSGKLVQGFYGQQIIELDVTPAYIVRQILTSPIFGFQTQAIFGFSVTDARVDPTTYAQSVQYCIDNGIKVSVTYTSQDDVLSIITELMGLYNGFLSEHGGTIYFGKISPDDVNAPFRTIDNTHLISPGPGEPPVEVTKGAIQDGYNKIQFNYLDRALAYKQNVVEVSDEVDIDFNGPRNLQYPAKFVMSGSLASQIAERALWSNLYGKDNYSFKLGAKDADLRPGKIITLVDSFDPVLKTGVKAIITKWDEQKRLEFSVEAVRLFNNHLSASHAFTRTSSPDIGPASMIQAIQPCINFNAYELPAEFQGTQGNVFVGYNQGSAIMGAQLLISGDGSNFVVDQDAQPFLISGRLGSALPLRSYGYVETDVELWLMPTSGFNISSPTFVQTHDLDDASPSARANGSTVIIVGSEAMAMEGLTLLGQNHYRVAKMYRGWGGTPIGPQNSGDFWHHWGAGVFAHPITPDKIGNIVWYKVVPYNFAGDAYDVSSVQARTYQVKGDYWLPRIQSPIKVFVNSPVAWSRSLAFDGQNLMVTSGGSDVALTWRQSANFEGFGYAGANAGQAGHFVSDANTVSYRVDVFSLDGTKVASYATATTSFNYTLAQNSADFNGFAKDVIYKVTPYNSRGDGYAPGARSLSLAW